MSFNELQVATYVHGHNEAVITLVTGLLVQT